MVRRLSNKEIRKLSDEISELSKKDIIEIDECNGTEVVYINGTCEFFRYKGKFIPTLKRIYAGRPTQSMKSITVDMGAVKFVTNGADIMRPGIKEIEDGITKGEIITIKEISHGKILALGEALFNSEEMRAMDKGKAVKNIHYIGDKLWAHR